MGGDFIRNPRIGHKKTQGKGGGGPKIFDRAVYEQNVSL